VELPIGIKDPLERLAFTHATLNSLKDSPMVMVQNLFENTVGGNLPWSVSKSPSRWNLHT
jgi:hypothetical protein